MSLEKALVAELNNNVGVGTRIYPLVIPESNGNQSAVVYTRVTTQRYHCFGTDATLQTPRMQIDCYAMSYPAALTIANAVVARLQNASTLGGGAGAVNVAVITRDEAQTYEEETKRYRVRVDFHISYEGS